jgi:hypothetical protein
VEKQFYTIDQGNTRRRIASTDSRNEEEWQHRVSREWESRTRCGSDTKHWECRDKDSS